MADNFIIDALRKVGTADAMPFGAATTPEGSPTALSAMLSGLMGMPKHLIEGAKTATPGLRREDATDVPGTAQPNKPLYDAATETALALAGVGAPAAEAGAAGIFGGKLSPMADLKALQEAERMRSHGLHPNDVWQDTNWAKYPTDGKWRFEIPDHKASLSAGGMPYVEGDVLSARLKSFLDHSDLYKAYPEMQTYPTHVTKDSTRSGMFDNGRIYAAGPNRRDITSVMMHEGQHGVQAIEDFAGGADPAHYAGLIEQGLRKRPDKFSAYDFNAIKKEADNLYHKTAGEVESRNVQKRLDYTPVERRIIPPWATQDVEFKNQVIFDPVKGTIEALRYK